MLKTYNSDIKTDRQYAKSLKMNESEYQNLLKLIQQQKVSIETHRFGSRPFLKSLWLKFSCAYIRFRAVRDYECFQEVYRSNIISLRLADGKIISYPIPLEDVLRNLLENPQVKDIL